MKIKIIFITFNAVILLSFLLIFLVPLLVLGREYFSFFASRNWLAALLFLVTFLLANLYFLLNWKLFSLLEREDWPRLVRYLEERVYSRGTLRVSQVRLLVNAYLLTSALDQIRRLESHLAERRPRLLDRIPIPFAVPYLLKAPPEEAEKYFRERLARPALNGREWMRWNLAFTLVQGRRLEEARVELLGLLERLAGRDPLLRLLSLYLLDFFAGPEAEGREQVEREKTALRRRIGRGRMQRLADRSRRNMEVLILSRLIRDAQDWLYAPEGTAPVPETPAPPDRPVR